MKKMICALALLFGIFSQTNSTNYNGTTGVIFVSYDQPFSNAESHTMTGFVRFENGCTVVNYSSAPAGLIWDACIPFSGGLDLRDTNSLTLIQDFICDTNFTLSSGGNIYGNGNSIVLSGNLTIPAGEIVHIGNNTIIDGGGHELIVGSWAQIFVDTNQTLTLSNLILRNGNHSLSFPPVRLASLSSKLALSNVEIAATGDFLFPQGQLFIHDDVSFTGTSSFVYWSTQQSFITPNSTLYFDSGTTFSVAPATSTANRFDNKWTATINNFINLVDQSSQLIFNNCSFKTTLTGCRLRSGNVLFDNAVSMDSRATSTISETGATQVGSNVVLSAGQTGITWAPNSRFIATSGNTDLQIYSFDGFNTPIPVGSGVSIGSSNTTPRWSPDGRFIAVSSYTGAFVKIYSFDGVNTPVQAVPILALGANPIDLSWSPDGRSFAVLLQQTELRVYSFDGVSTPSLLGSIATTGSNPYGCSWSPNGGFIVTISLSGSLLLVFSVDKFGNLASIGSVGIVNPVCTSWTPSNGFLITYTAAVNQLAVHRFNGTRLNRVLIFGNTGLTAKIGGLTCSPDGKYFAIGGSATPGQVAIYSFEYPSLRRVAIIYPNDTGVSFLSWSPDGRFIATTGNNANLQIFAINKIVDHSVQAITNSFVFGNSALGSGYDANINLLSAANLDLNTGCKVLINNVNN